MTTCTISNTQNALLGVSHDMLKAFHEYTGTTFLYPRLSDDVVIDAQEIRDLIHDG